MTDYANTPYAARNRLEKAKKIAAWCWAHGVTAAHINYATDTEWAKVAREATGRSASDKTREITWGLTIVKEAWAAANPTHPGAKRPAVHPDYISALTPGARP